MLFRSEIMMNSGRILICLSSRMILLVCPTNSDTKGLCATLFAQSQYFELESPYPTFLNFRSDRKFTGIGSFGNNCGHWVHDTSPT